MYSNSEELLTKIKEVSNEIYIKSNNLIEFEEYIILPYYGNIILRFNIHQDDLTLNKLDEYEAMMSECAKDDFLIDFMGSVYRKVGLEPQKLNQILPRCYEKYHHIEICKSYHEKYIQEDGKYLLELCGLNVEQDIWEIQLEDEINILILGKEFKDLGRFNKNEMMIHVYEVSRYECEGLMKATMFSKNNKVSLVRTLLECEE